MSANLLALRAQCEATIKAIDEILGDLPESLTPDPHKQPFVVTGICTEITAHAIIRYRERTGTKKGEVATLNKIRERMEKAEEWRLKQKFRLIELLAHGTPSRFFKDDDMLFVVENGLVITCHHATGNRWEPMPKLAVAS